MEKHKIFKANGSDDYILEVLRNNPKVLIKIGHDGCPPCRVITKSIETLDTEFVLLDMDVAEHPIYNKHINGGYPTWCTVENQVFTGAGSGYPRIPITPEDFLKAHPSKIEVIENSRLVRYIDNILNLI